MKTTLLFAAIIFSSALGLAQADTTPPFKRFPVIPAVSLLKSDNAWLTKADLKKNLATIIMYFAPNCDHCIHQFNDMVVRMKDLKKYQIVMATHQPMEELVAFQKKYELHKYSNIQLGRDTKFALISFYRIRNLPYLALYDKNGNLITSFDGNVKVDKLVEAFH